MDTTRLNDFGRRYAEAWCSHDPKSVAAFFSEGGTLSVNDGPPEEAAKVAQGFITDFPDIIVTMDKVMPRSGGAEFHWTFTGRNTGPGGTGKRVQITGYEDWTFGADGLVATSKGHYDAAEYERQLREGVEG